MWAPGKWVAGALVVAVVAGIARTSSADVPEVVVAGKGHRYVVWLNPLLEDGVTKPALTDADITRYCGAAQGFAERMWRMTNGRHRIFQVEFNYGTKPMRNDIVWNRYHGTSHANGLGSKLFIMHDSITLARHTWSEGTQPADHETCDASGICIQANCPPGLTYTSSGSLNRELCVDQNGHSPLKPATEAAQTLAHELSHSHYNIDDEYFLGMDPILYGFRICANPADWHTSIMATATDFWCDQNTHLFERKVGSSINSPFEGTKNVGNPHLEELGSSWQQAQGFWADLASYKPGQAIPHAPDTMPENELITKPVGPWAPLPTDEFCVFTGDEFSNAVLNDIVVVVDKSGSMSYRTTPADFTAFQAAFAAGLGHFNRTVAKRKSGLTVFDSTVNRLIPYQTGGTQHAITEYNLAAGGSTNLCSAISDTAAQIRAGGTDDSAGHLILLTDGRPTVAGCNTAQAVRDAAQKACSPTDGSKPVVISALAFGDADYALIQQISDICGGAARQIDGSGQPCPPGQTCNPSIPAGVPAPIDIKVASSRLGYYVRGYTEGMFAAEPKPAVFERSFDVPPSTTELEVAWMGEGAAYNVIPVPTIKSPLGSTQTKLDSGSAELGGPITNVVSGTLCEFANDYGFELVDPNGVPAGSDVVTPATELGYLTRTRRVFAPIPGRWTMRMTGGAPCVVGGSQPAPKVAMFANYRNNKVHGEVRLDKTVVGSNELARATAVLSIGPDSAATNINVTAKLVNGSTSVPVPMFDDGVNGGDETAGDGRYSGLINPSCSSATLAPGAYRFLVDFSSNGATAVAVLHPAVDIRAEAGVNAAPLSGPISVSLLEEKMFTVRNCQAPTPGCASAPPVSNACPAQTASVDGSVEIHAGQTTHDITVTVHNFPIGTTGVTVGVGPGVETTNVRSTYDDATGIGTVTFDATAQLDAPDGSQPIKIFWGPTRFATDGAIIPVFGCPALPDFDGDGIGDACDDNSLVANAGPDQLLECTTPDHAPATLNGSGSGAPNGSVSYAWSSSVALAGVNQSIASGSFPVGTTAVNLTVSQGAVQKSDSALITVLDMTPPLLTIPADIVTTSCTGVSIGTATATDVCGGTVTVVNNAPASYRAGVTFVTWTAIDRYGNSIQRTQRVTVGLGDNAACCPSGSHVIQGTSNNDTLTGTSGVDCILGKGAQDVIRGLGGNDFLSGGDGDDIIEGGLGDDVIQGGTGQDTLRGDDGRDTITGNDGDDSCYGGNQDDWISGGLGQDHLFGETGNDSLLGNEGNDELNGAAGNDICTRGSGIDTVTSCETVQ